MSVYLSVAPPDGFVRWGDAEWDRWLREHPWEAAERVCSRGDWTVFLYQLRQHADGARKLIEPLLEQLVNERPLTAQQTEDLRDALDIARDELDKKPAGTRYTRAFLVEGIALHDVYHAGQVRQLKAWQARG